MLGQRLSTVSLLEGYCWSSSKSCKPVLNLLAHFIWNFRMSLLVVIKVEQRNFVFKKVNIQMNTSTFFFLVAAEK